VPRSRGDATAIGRSVFSGEPAERGLAVPGLDRGEDQAQLVGLVAGAAEKSASCQPAPGALKVSQSDVVEPPARVLPRFVVNFA
jgi:hypothetical protein